MALVNAELLPQMSSDDIELELMLLAEKSALEPWEKTQAARMRVELQSRDPAAVQVKKRGVVRKAAKSQLEIERSARALLASMGNDPVLEDIMRRGGLIS